MSLHKINGYDLVRCVKSGCIKLEHNRDQVDMLNVFPVPDGDTGTNMYLTLLAAVKEGEKHSQDAVGKAAKAVSMGSLMGARGNSGVILSQIFRGIARVLEGEEQADAMLLAQALRAGSDTAYKAVMKPVEGTILTVIREVSRACEKQAEQGSDIIETLLFGIQEGYSTLEKTPSMLPALKEAGVVDSGGQGLMYFLEGALDGLASDKEIELEDYRDRVVSTRKESSQEAIELEYQYCTEVLVKGQGLDPEDLKDHLRPLGDSMLVVGDEEIVKIHIHSNHPGKVLETALQQGALVDIKINNMLEEVHEHLNNWEESAAPSYEKEVGLVAVSVGDGIAEILSSLGVDEIVTGGQTMNPSTEDLLKACERVSAPQIILFPNNSNIFMAASQVAELSEKEVRVIPSKSVMQAISALITYNPQGDLDEMEAAMQEQIEGVAYAEITRAVRDSELNGLDIKDGDLIGIINGEISQRGQELEEIVISVLDDMTGEDNELITLLYGEEQSEEEAHSILEKIEARYEDFEVEMHSGGQPHYYYLLSVE